MKYTALGHSGLNVSRICLGCMSFGDRASGFHQWTLNEEDSEAVIAHALDAGINFFDTANVYSKGTSEEYTGKALKKLTQRDKVILASKVYFNDGHLSSEAIHREIEGTLQRLQTDYLDLYIIHRFDRTTPIEETMETLNDLVKSGKVRAIGASAMYGYQFYDMQMAAERHGWTKFTSMQNHYNLLYREDERELIPICREMNVARTSYSPLASGHLCRPQWDTDSERSRNDKTMVRKYNDMEEEDLPIIARVHELAEKRGASMTQIALAWQYAKGVESPILGVTKIKHLDDALGALDIDLSEEEVSYLEEPYRPHPIVGAL